MPYPPGGGTDVVARIVQDRLRQELGQPILIDNRGGAAGHVGSVSVARARPDATTLLFAVSTNIVVNPHLQKGDRLDLATALHARGDVQAAVDQLLDLFRRDREWNEGAAKAQLFQVFDALPPKDPIALAGRRRLSSMIFA